MVKSEKIVLKHNSIKKDYFEVVIILVNYNSNHDTIDCIKSISKIQNEKLPFLIVVDNSPENKLDDSDLVFYCNIKLIKSETNLGFGKANNLAIEWSNNNLNFDYVLLLNNDTIVTQNFLTELKSPFILDDDIGVTTGLIFYEDNRKYVWYGGGDINRLKMWPNIYDFNSLQTFHSKNSKYVSFVSGCLMMISRKTLKKLKGFDNDFFMYCEDLDFSLRASKLNVRMYYNSDAVIYHKLQKSSIQKLDKEQSIKKKIQFVYFNMKLNQLKCIVKHNNRLILFHSLLIYFFDSIYFLLKNILVGRFYVIMVLIRIYSNNFKYLLSNK